MGEKLADHTLEIPEFIVRKCMLLVSFFYDLRIEIFSTVNLKYIDIKKKLKVYIFSIITNMKEKTKMQLIF